MSSVFADVLIVLGLAVMTLGVVGVLRFPDVYTQLASGKPRSSVSRCCSWLPAWRGTQRSSPVSSSSSSCSRSRRRSRPTSSPKRRIIAGGDALAQGGRRKARARASGSGEPGALTSVAVAAFDRVGSVGAGDVVGSVFAEKPVVTDSADKKVEVIATVDGVVGGAA